RFRRDAREICNEIAPPASYSKKCNSPNTIKTNVEPTPPNSGVCCWPDFISVAVRSSVSTKLRLANLECQCKRAEVSSSATDEARDGELHRVYPEIQHRVRHLGGDLNRDRTNGCALQTHALNLRQRNDHHFRIAS